MKLVVFPQELPPNINIDTTESDIIIEKYYKLSTLQSQEIIKLIQYFTTDKQYHFAGRGLTEYLNNNIASYYHGNDINHDPSRCVSCCNTKTIQDLDIYLPSINAHDYNNKVQNVIHAFNSSIGVHNWKIMTNTDSELLIERKRTVSNIFSTYELFNSIYILQI